MMKITLIAHSGFLMETTREYLLFDYWKGSLPEMDGKKPLFVFVSHSHADHYSEKIYDLPAAAYILSSDVPKESQGNVSTPVCRIAPHHHLDLAPHRIPPGTDISERPDRAL